MNDKCCVFVLKVCSYVRGGRDCVVLVICDVFISFFNVLVVNLLFVSRGFFE